MVYNDVAGLVATADRIRLARGMSVLALCERSGVRPSTYYGWLEGARTPNTVTLARVLDTLGVRIELKEERYGSAGNG